MPEMLALLGPPQPTIANQLRREGAILFPLPAGDRLLLVGVLPNVSWKC